MSRKTPKHSDRLAIENQNKRNRSKSPDDKKIKKPKVPGAASSTTVPDKSPYEHTRT